MTNQIGRYLEDFTIGEEIDHPLSKTIFESDNNLFSLLTMNYHPVHTNVQYANKQQHGQILVVGTLVFSLSVGLTVPEISGKAIANLEYQKVRHLAPVFLGDTIYAKTTVLNVKNSASKLDRGTVEVSTLVTNQNGLPVLVFERVVLVKRRDHD
jgi:acyl dehydratase